MLSSPLPKLFAAFAPRVMKSPLQKVGYAEEPILIMR